MELREVLTAIDAKVLCCEERIDGINIETAYACDLMSDVLAFCAPGSLLMTGLTNIQIVRAAQMLDIPAILFVRGKTPQEETVALANKSGIPIILSNYSLYEACGILYAKGLPPCTIEPREK